MIAPAIFGFIACEKVEENFESNPIAGKINFQAPVVGQENLYLRYAGTCDALEATTDTLRLSVVSVTEDSVVFHEQFTAGSLLASPNATEIRAGWNEDFLGISEIQRQQSTLFYFYGSDMLKLTEHPTRKFYQSACKIQDISGDFQGDAIGRVREFEVGNRKFHQKKVVSCVPVIFEIDGYLVYDEHHLYSSYTSSVTGCCANPIPEQHVQAFVLMTE
jgi:hypothetical protein